LFLSFVSTKVLANDKEEGTLLNLSATEMMPVEQDLIIANLRYEIDGASAKDVQNRINQVMKKALDFAKSDENIQVSTNQYSIYKFFKTDEKGQNGKEIWRGSQSLILKSKNFDDTLVLTGKLQELGLMMSDMHHEISPEKAEEVKNSMMENAIKKLLTRAGKAANVIGAKEVKVKTINLEGDNFYNPTPYPKMMMRASGASEDMAQPASAADKVYINLTVSGTILLKD